jgi:hypothetical protein
MGFPVTMITIRQLHAYIGLFIAPSVLFFALTGSLQLFDLHEAHGGYQPFALIEKLSSVHKNQVFAFGDHHVTDSGSETQKPAGGTTGAAEEDEDKTELSTVMLRVFYLLVALCLVLSTALGLWMGLTQTRRRRVAWVLLIAGALIPVGLLLVS